MEDEEKTQETTIPVIEEKLVTGARPVKSGSVRVRKKVERALRNIEMPVVREELKVTRVPVNRTVTEMPKNRQEGDTLIIPVVEEEIVVKRQFMVKEEIHIQRRRVESTAHRTVEVGREHATIERLDADGNVLSTSSPATAETHPARLRKFKSVIK